MVGTRGERSDRRDRESDRGREREDRDRRDERKSSSTSSSAPPLKRLKPSPISHSSVESSSQSSRKSDSSSKQASDAHVAKYDVLQVTLDAMRKEEERAIATDPAQDLQKFNSVCTSIKAICADILKMKLASGNGNKVDDEKLNELKKKGSLMFLDLKTLNRYDKFRSKDAKDKLQLVRQKVDSHHLRLQNLLYEVMHLQKECKTCETFKSKDEDIELVPKEEFFAEAPSELAQPALEKDPHKLHLARLEWELNQRKELEEKLKSAESIKKKCEEEIAGKKEALEKLQPTLKTVVDAAQPLYAQLDMPLQAHEETHANAEHLPRALYVLYVQMIAYRHASKGKFDVTITGNVEDAKALALSALDDKEDDEDELDEDEGRGRKSKKSRHRQKSIAATKTSGLKKLVAMHPMGVVFTIKSLDQQLICQFSYLLKLEIITVKVHVQQKDMTHNEVVSDTLLSHLFPNDDGLTSPNPANLFLINSYGVDNFSCLIYEVGFAYKWAQKLAGLEFIGVDPTKNCSSTISISWMDRTIKCITDRFNSRLLLQQQLRELKNGMVLLPQEIQAVTCTQVYSSVKELTLVSSNMVHNELSKNVHLQDAIDLGVVNVDRSFIYKIKLENGSAVMFSIIIIPIDYPKSIPFFHTSIFWITERTSSNDSGLRELEEKINIECAIQMPESASHQLLAYQVHQLQLGFDVYLESHQSASSSGEGPKEFSQKKMFTQLTAGRDHVKPYNYDKRSNTFLV